MPPTIVIPTTAQLQQAHNSPTSLLAMYQAAQQPKPIAGSPGAVTAAESGNPTLNNLSNPEWITSMSDMINQINQSAQQKANAGRALSGQLPDDLVRQLAQRSAERGVFTGSPSGANSTADLMRSIGLNSLDLQGKGQDWLSAALGRNPAAPIANTQALVTTPAQAEQLRLQERGQELAYLSHLQDLAAGRYANHTGYGGNHPTSGGGGGFNPATNWYNGGGPTMTATPTPAPWHLPYSLDGNNQLPNDYLDQFYNQGTNPPVTTPTYDTTPSDWNNLLPPMSPDYGGPGGLSDEDYFNLYGG